MLVTTSFAKAESYPGEKYAVCRTKPAQGPQYPLVTYLFPTDAMLKKVKEGEITAEQFTERYQKILETNRQRLLKLKSMLEQQQRDIVLVCHCPEDSFCHRALIARYLLDQLGLDPALVEIH